MARDRASWDEYFMNIARAVATRATCDRKHVGAVIVREKSILATGYNGSIRGLPHCDEDGHLMEDGHCVRTVHAEANAIVQAARNGVRIEGATIYVTASPCFGCFKMIANGGITKIVYGEFYRDERSLELARQLGIAMVHVATNVVGRWWGAHRDRGVPGLRGVDVAAISTVFVVDEVDPERGILAYCRHRYGLGRVWRERDGVARLSADADAQSHLRSREVREDDGARVRRSSTRARAPNNVCRSDGAKQSERSYRDVSPSVVRESPSAHPARSTPA
jgi:dCMP deaminase